MILVGPLTQFQTISKVCLFILIFIYLAGPGLSCRMWGPVPCSSGCTVAQWCPTPCNPMDCMLPARFFCPWQEYWSGLPFPPPGGVFPTQESNRCLLHWQVGSLPLSHQGSPRGDLISLKTSMIFSIHDFMAF